MTRDEILNMPAGREMDALVAERVFGYSVTRNMCTWDRECGYWMVITWLDEIKPDELEEMNEKADFYDNTENAYPEYSRQHCFLNEYEILETVPEYSTDIAAAWQVVDALKDKHGEVYFEWRNDCYPNPRQWLAMFGDLDDDIIAYADALPLAICRAALLAAEEVTGG